VEQRAATGAATRTPAADCCNRCSPHQQLKRPSATVLALATDQMVQMLDGMPSSRRYERGFFCRAVA
jgi:hypothetical protein